MNISSENHIKEAASLIAGHADLSQLHVKDFWHDMTFGDGAVALLSNNPEVPLDYHQNKSPSSIAIKKLALGNSSLRSFPYGSFTLLTQ